MDLVDLLRQKILDQDELGWLCGPDAPPPRPVDAAPLTARELITSPQPPPRAARHVL